MGFQFDLKGRFESFIEEFTDQEGKLRYQDEIREMEPTGARSLYISYNDLLIQDPKLAREILLNPEESFLACNEVLESKLDDINPGYLERLKQVHIRITDLPEKLMLRSLKTEHLGILTCFEGIVIGVTDAKPLMIRGHFKCASCGDDNQIVDFPEGIFSPPYQCRNEQCQRKGSLQLQLDKSTFIDWQKITLQEKPEELPPGQLPQSTSIHVLDDLVDQARPGDRVEIVGILKARASRLLKRGQLATYNKFFHGISVGKETAEYVDIEISDEDELKIIDLSKSPYIIEKIRDSLAPSIYGHDVVKEAIAALLFGGTPKETSDGMKLRGESNILIVGDPGTGKSIHGSEHIYIGSQSSTNLRWRCKEIGVFIDDLMNIYQKGIISAKETEILKLGGEQEIYTLSIDPHNLNTQKSRIMEVSRHQTQELISIHTQSGRRILATPDHSFSTLVNGRLEVISAVNLHKSQYLPIARNIQFNQSEFMNSICFSEIFPSEDLVRVDAIRNQIIKIQQNEINVLTAAKIANITPGTLRKYMNDITSIPEEGWVRRKVDTSWFPRNVELNEEFGRIVGFYLAEGHTEKTNTRFTNKDDEIREIIQNDLQSIFGRCSVYKNDIALNQSSLNKWFEATFGTGAENKKLPSLFLATPLRFRKALLSAYFTGDGWIEEKSASVSATTKSRSLAYSISDLLATIGIFSSVKTKIIKSGKYLGNVYYRINISGEELYSFYTHIGFVSSSKQNRLEEFTELLCTRKRYQSRDVIPNFGSLITDVAKVLGLTSRRSTWERSFLGELRGKKHRQRVGRKYLQKIVKKFKELNKGSKTIDKLDRLEILASSDIFWDRITKIETIVEPTTVYDIGTQDGHFIVAKGNLIVHNSQILKFVSQLAPRALYTTGKGSTAAGLCVSGDSRIFLEDGIVPISNVVNNEFKKGEIKHYNDFIEYREVKGDIRVLHSQNLKINSNRISRVWRIKSPECLVQVITKKGKQLKLTPETSLLSFHPDVGLIWKPSKFLQKKDLVATTDFSSPMNIKNIQDSNVSWDEISDIEEIKTQDNYVYDLTIPETHNFIVNGFVTHNTAAVIRDQDTGEITLEAGALVLADQGIAMVDEFDKMRADDRTAIHEAMEQHTISIAKAGIVATLNARTSILAAANPRRGRWNPFKATAENLNLPPTILSRFDLIFVLEDRPDLKEDHDLASHILKLHKSQALPSSPPIEQELLRKYIAYARREIHPRLSGEAEERLLEYYKELRMSSGKIEEGKVEPIAITPRQLEALVRLAEARAKMRLSNEVSYDDASGAVNLMNATLEKLAKDAETGKLDIDKYSSGMSAGSRRRLDQIEGLIDRMLEQAEEGDPVAIKDIIDQGVEEGLNKNQVVKAIDEMTRRGVLFEPQPGFIKRP